MSTTQTAVATVPDDVSGQRGRIAVVGAGPRGISVVEQLIMHADESVRIDVYDSRLVGAGRIWHPEQSKHLLMNTHAGEVSIFAGPMDDGPARAGAGPSLQQWLVPDDGVYSGYAPRADYGRYLRFAFDSFVEITEHHDTVVAVRRHGENAFTLRTRSGHVRVYDAVVLATGHPQPKAADFISTRKPGSTRILSGDSAADLPLDEIKPGQAIATMGMGLAFHDVVALLTQGRGGLFRTGSDGALEYAPSGEEPVITGVSRSGLPIPSRGRNQKPGDFRFTPRLCTVERMRALRACGRQVDFTREVGPWIRAEAAVTFCLTTIALGSQPARAGEFIDRLGGIDESDPAESLYRIAAEFGVRERFPSMKSLARPFEGMQFSSRGQWMDALAAHLQADLDHAREGNVTNPLKAALDTLRDLRPSIRAVVDNGGLTPDSHEHGFLGEFVPQYSLLVAGPPPRRIEELLALMRARVVSMAGPQARIVEDGHELAVQSPAVPGSVTIERVIDARIPRYEAGRCSSPLFPQLLADGLVRRFRHVGAEVSTETGACETDPDTAGAIGADGTPVRGLFLLGIPTERQRWFTQIGNGRPGVRSGFTVDAERVARSALATVAKVVRP